MLTPEQLAKIRAILARRHAAVALELYGGATLTGEELADLENEGIIVEPGDLVGDAYKVGRLLAESPARAAQLAPGDLDVWSAGESLTDDEQRTVAAARQVAGQHLQGLTDRVLQATGQLLTAEQQRLIVREQVADAAATQASVRTLRSTLGQATQDWGRDLERVAHTELHTAHQVGQAARYREMDPSGDPWVYKVPQPGACAECLRLHLGPDGLPRMVRLSTLDPNNVGRKRVDWQVVVGSTHPNCTCLLRRMPEGWGFDEHGDPMPGGEAGLRYENGEALTRALAREDTLQKGFVKGRLTYQGLPIAIENPPGSVRQWKDSTGRTGETRMEFAYGYIDGTEGADGDAVDVFIGPDPDAPFAFVVHQNRGRAEIPAHAQAWARQTYDEDKVMLGWRSAHAAKAAYLRHYDSPEFLGAVSMLSVEDLRGAVQSQLRPGAGFVKSYQDPVVNTGTTGFLLSQGISRQPRQPEVVSHPGLKLREFAAMTRERAKDDRERLLRHRLELLSPPGAGKRKPGGEYHDSPSRAEVAQDSRDEALNRRWRVEQETQARSTSRMRDG